jgi:hypothetical protein
MLEAIRYHTDRGNRLAQGYLTPTDNASLKADLAAPQTPHPQWQVLGIF